MNQIFQENKYAQLYHRIIAKHGHQQKPGGGYYERHHVIPKSMGGDDGNANLRYVRVRVHFLLHVILVKAVHQEYQRRARWCVVCFSTSNDRQLVRRKLKSRFVQATREAHNADLKLLKWYNNGVETTRLFPEESIPVGFVKGRLKLPTRAGVVYITDGVHTKRIKQCLPIPLGWTLGQKLERVKQIAEQGKAHKMGSGAGRAWVNDGVANRYLMPGESLPYGWVRGRLKIGRFNPSDMRSKSKGTTSKVSAGPVLP